MSITRIITDIPPNQTSFVIALILADNGTFQTVDEPDGEVTIIATFPGPEPPTETPLEGSQELGWVKIAQIELDRGVEAGRDTSRIEQYHTTTRGDPASDSVPWCSSFVNFCVEEAGFEGTKSRRARSWLEWGVDAGEFVPGCIVVLKRGTPPKGHVGFYVGRESGRVRLLGGNQSEKVSIASFDIDRVIGKRLPL
jgi:uncharacterized protein (TIGR02594 family)